MTENEINFREPKLKEIYKKIIETPATDLQVQAIIMRQNKEKEEIWSVRDLKITESLAESIKQIVFSYIEGHSEVGIRDFAVTNDQSDEYLIEKLPDDEVPVLSKIISEMQRSDNEDIPYDKLAKTPHLKGFAITFSSSLIVFNKVTRSTLLKPKKYLYFIPSPTGEFTGIYEENLLSIPKSIDAILYEDPLFIFNRYNFIQLFKYEGAFEHFITSAKQSLSRIVDDFQSLIDKSEKDIRQYRRLASACAGFVERIVQKGVNLEPIARDYKLDISFSNGKVVFHDSALNDVLKLLNGQAVKDAIFGDKYIAQEKTEV